MPNNQKGIAQILIVILLVAGLGAGLVLSQQTAIFKSKASEPPIWAEYFVGWQSDSTWMSQNEMEAVIRQNHTLPNGMFRPITSSDIAWQISAPQNLSVEVFQPGVNGMGYPFDSSQLGVALNAWYTVDQTEYSRLSTSTSGARGIIHSYSNPGFLERYYGDINERQRSQGELDRYHASIDPEALRLKLGVIWIDPPPLPPKPAGAGDHWIPSEGWHVWLESQGYTPPPGWNEIDLTVGKFCQPGCTGGDCVATCSPGEKCERLPFEPPIDIRVCVTDPNAGPANPGMACTPGCKIGIETCQPSNCPTGQDCSYMGTAASICIPHQDPPPQVVIPPPAEWGYTRIDQTDPNWYVGIPGISWGPTGVPPSSAIAYSTPEGYIVVNYLGHAISPKPIPGPCSEPGMMITYWSGDVAYLSTAYGGYQPGTTTCPTTISTTVTPPAATSTSSQATTSSSSQTVLSTPRPSPTPTRAPSKPFWKKWLNR